MYQYLESHTSGHLIHGGLGHLVGQGPGVGPQAGDAGDVDNAAGPGHEVGEALLGECDGGLEVDLHAEINVLHGDLLEAGPGEDPGVVNQNIQSWEERKNIYIRISSTSKVVESLPDGLSTLSLGLEVGRHDENLVPEDASQHALVPGVLQSRQVTTQQR